MAHELEIRDGNASFVFNGQLPWHGLGQRLDGTETLPEVMAQARVDYDVTTEPLYRKRTTLVETTNHLPSGQEVTDSYETAEYVESTLARVTVRSDTGVELGRVSPDYVPVQNREAFAVIEPLIEHGLARIETCDVLRDGRDAFLCVQLDASAFQWDEFTGTEQLAMHGLVRANHSGRAGVAAAVTSVRVVCANTLGMVESGNALRMVNVRHTGEAQARFAEAAGDLWSSFVTMSESLRAQYTTLRHRFLDETMFRELVLKAAVVDPRTQPQFNPSARTAEAVVDRYERKVSRITQLWTAGKGHTGDRSAWEAYNGLVEAMDHDRDLWPVRGGAWRAASFLDGEIARTKGRVLQRLVAAADAGELLG